MANVLSGPVRLAIGSDHKRGEGREIRSEGQKTSKNVQSVQGKRGTTGIADEAAGPTDCALLVCARSLAMGVQNF